MKFLLISGSLRKDSYNTRLLRYIASKFLESYEYEIAEIGSLPLYSEDIDAQDERVRKFKASLKNTDIVIFSTPEHNWSISAAIKNAVDWGSRPPSESVWRGKVAVVMSVSTGMLGGARAQYHLRQILSSVDVIQVTKPEVFISFAQDKFIGDVLNDELASNLIRDSISNAVKLYEIYKR